MCACAGAGKTVCTQELLVALAAGLPALEAHTGLGPCTLARVLRLRSTGGSTRLVGTSPGAQRAAAAAGGGGGEGPLAARRRCRCPQMLRKGGGWRRRSPGRCADRPSSAPSTETIRRPHRSLRAGTGWQGRGGMQCASWACMARPHLVAEGKLSDPSPVGEETATATALQSSGRPKRHRIYGPHAAHWEERTHGA